MIRNDEARSFWSVSQRRGAMAIVCVVLLVLAWRLVWNRQLISAPPPDVGERAGELISRLDPNLASEAQLSVLPLFGPSRAKAVVALREQLLQESGRSRAFEKLDDLSAVKGIGPGVLKQIEPYLTFDLPTTRDMSR